MEGKMAESYYTLFNEFLKICKQLNSINITPTLMGSLGLQYLTDENWIPSDIDIHVEGDPRGWEAPDEDRIYNWDAILTLMLNLGYELVDIHEHEFHNKGISVEYGAVNTLPEFAKVELNDLSLIEESGVKFYLPTLRQYLNIYQASSKDSYRNDNNNFKGFRKIEYLIKQLKIDGESVS